MIELLRLFEKSLVFTFLVCSMLAMGLNLTLQAVFAQLRNVQLMLLALALNFILAPAFAWLLTVVIPLQRGHAIGVLLLGAAAGAPFLPTLVETARGDLAAATALMVLLTLGTIGFMPFALPVLIPGLPADTWSIARPLLIFIVLPMVVGTLIKPHGRPRFAGRAAPVLAKIGNTCLLLFFVLLIALNIRALLGVVGSGAIAAALFYVIGLFVPGWLLGGPKLEVRSVIAFGTARAELRRGSRSSCHEFPRRYRHHDAHCQRHNRHGVLVPYGGLAAAKDGSLLNWKEKCRLSATVPCTTQ
jgi:BASS family bile acid:Na+ symporter